jgi:hypothetical protein
VQPLHRDQRAMVGYPTSSRCSSVRFCGHKGADVRPLSINSGCRSPARLPDKKTTPARGKLWGRQPLGGFLPAGGIVRMVRPQAINLRPASDVRSKQKAPTLVAGAFRNCAPGQLERSTATKRHTAGIVPEGFRNCPTQRKVASSAWGRSKRVLR